MKRLHLVEDYHSSCLYFGQDGGVRIALTPMAAWRLDGAGMEYNIPEHYGIWDEIGDGEYRLWFMGEWLPYLADATGLDVSVFHYLLTPLRFMMESFLRRAYQVKWILEKEDPDAIHYFIAVGKKRSTIDGDLYRKNGSLFYSIFSAYRPSMGVFHVPVSDQSRGGFPLRDAVRGPYDWLRTLRFLPAWKRGTLCFANTVPDKMREAKLRGFRVRALPRLAREFYVPYTHWISIPLRAMSFLNRTLGFPVNVCAVLEDQLTRFFCDFLPEVLVLKEGYKKYLSSQEFSYIIFNRRNKAHLYAAHMAAREIGFKTVYVRHGWSADDAWENIHTRLRSFDYFSVLTQEDHAYYRDLCEREGLQCKVI